MHYRDSIPTNAANNSRGKQIAWEVGLLADLSCCQLFMQKTGFVHVQLKARNDKQTNELECLCTVRARVRVRVTVGAMWDEGA